MPDPYLFTRQVCIVTSSRMVVHAPWHSAQCRTSLDQVVEDNSFNDLTCI